MADDSAQKVLREALKLLPNSIQELPHALLNFMKRSLP